MTYKLPTEFRTLAALNQIPGVSSGDVVGSNDSIPSSVFIILSNVTSSASPANFPASAQQMQVVSDNANDTGAGTGTQQVQITYLTSPSSIFGFQQFTETVTLNGVTPVNTVATNIFRINRFRVSKVGINLFSVGNISLQTVGGATTFERIDAGTNINRSAVHYVQNKFGCILTEYQFGCSTAGGTIFILEETELDNSSPPNAVTHGVHQLELTNNAITADLSNPEVILNNQNQIMFFAIVVKGRASNQTASGSLGFIDFPLP